MDEQKQEKKRKGGLVIGVIGVGVVVALLGVIIYLLLSRNAEPEEEKRNVVITSENVESVLKELDETRRVDPGYYTATMNTTWHFKTGRDVSYDAIVENVEANTNDVYFDIVMEGDEERVLYKSPLIPLGGRLEKIALEEVLDAGTYDCVAIYHLVDKDQNTLSTLRIALKIVIEG